MGYSVCSSVYCSLSLAELLFRPCAVKMLRRIERLGDQGLLSYDESLLDATIRWKRSAVVISLATRWIQQLWASWVCTGVEY